MPDLSITATASEIKPGARYHAVGDARRALIAAWMEWLGTNPSPHLVDIEANALSEVILGLAAAHKASRK